ncbi:UDP-glucose--hexose-1-phosphate uridylyltransferase [Chitinophaga arvensicola]|uniref:Galactose-1-phosphate uridylyltransferase n=1 Tax=Chitinophaga arvensicola TaxID=29529 RepID=A0A1I0RRE0_9BACT|nr:UDP-glucose--hexose-1-phosphate uridylyltransferase [Chitinophaga arvensicola]SEW43918.1 UDPglucose--hexose-1-phosphate uridylyltransferase [Chitinophaga arvensicola]
MNTFQLADHPHQRLNILTGEWVLVSPHRTKRPWQGKVEQVNNQLLPHYDASCYLCPGNPRMGGDLNPDYKDPFAFTNDFGALMADTPAGQDIEDELLHARAVKGICRVICFSPRHDLTLPLLPQEAIGKVIDLWQEEYRRISADSSIKYIQIFENKGEIMGCSNPHPHCQIWAASDVPAELIKETTRQQAYYAANGKSLLQSYIALEQERQERIVCENEHFIAVVPYWATWPFETMIISKRHVTNILAFNEAEKNALADILKRLTTKYDNLFETSFPYSAGMHQAPVNDGEHPEWHWHMHFYPPLLRSASVKKFMVGYELLASPQRDITPEWAAAKLQSLPEVHYAAHLVNSPEKLTI